MAKYCIKEELFYYDEGTVYFFYQVRANSEKGAKRKLRYANNDNNDGSYDLISLKVIENVSFNKLYEHLDFDKNDEEEINKDIQMTYEFFEENQLEGMEEFIRSIKKKD